MDQSTPSMSARGIAFLRAYHHKADIQKIFDDEFAHIFVSPEDWTLFETKVVNFLATGFEPTPGVSNEATLAQKMRFIITTSWAFSRDRFIYEKEQKAIANGFQQFVLIGAGFDTFALRCHNSQIRVVEVDHPATQRYKSEMLLKSGIQKPPNLYLEEADLEHEDLADILKSSAYDSSKETMFVLAGINMYLTESAVLKMLNAISTIAAPGSRVVFDYVDTEAFFDEKRSPRMSRLFEVLKTMGEPIITGFDPACLGDTLQSVGMRLLENVQPLESDKRYFKDHVHGYSHAEHVHFALAEITDTKR